MRALLSVWDKTGITELAKRLHASGFEIVSTGQTKAAIEASGVPVRAVADVTEFPEILDGRVKTLHPHIHGGLLARRDLPDHMNELASHGIVPIDLVVSNLYPFSNVVSKPESTLIDALENIDIGGPAMIRAAAKNFPSVIVIVDPVDYEWVAAQILESGLASVTLKQRRALAAKAFGHVSAYDAVIRQYLDDSGTFPEEITIAGSKISDLRYGENPHQPGAVYRQLSVEGPTGIAVWNQLAGKEMSYINYIDADAAWRAASGFAGPTVSIVKHASPCGIASADSLLSAYEMALASDPASAFGGVIALNREVGIETAQHVAGRYFEIVVAPSFTDEAVSRLKRRKNMRIIVAGDVARPGGRAVRQLQGGFLIQDVDDEDINSLEWITVTQRAPTAEERAGLEFAWKAVRYVMSNAIVLGVGTATVGIGGGQPNRVDAVRIAIQRAGDRARGSVMASDAYFPFADNIEVAAEGGITAIVQPGGSVRDEEVIEAANRAGIAMVVTGRRHFRH